ncbi:MAG: DUF3597 domain-containing protein [Gemmatimonadaceae bacterium]
MSILGTIMSKVFGHDTPAASPVATDASTTPAAAPASAPAPMSQADVEAILGEMAKQYNHPVNWQSSIVDLMAMLGLDNSLPQRRALAAELGYTGDTSDTATMNIWLHQQVMQKLEENGGVASPDLMA